MSEFSQRDENSNEYVWTARSQGRRRRGVNSVAIFRRFGNFEIHWNGCGAKFRMAQGVNVFLLLALAKGEMNEEEYILLLKKNDNGNAKQSNFPYRDL